MNEQLSVTFSQSIDVFGFDAERAVTALVAKSVRTIVVELINLLQDGNDSLLIINGRCRQSANDSQY